jgi:hypothetical protein
MPFMFGPMIVADARHTGSAALQASEKIIRSALQGCPAAVMQA